MTTLTLRVLDPELTVARLGATDPLPDWASGGTFLSLTRTGRELSIVCESARVSPGVRCERGWRALEVAGPLDFAMVGVLASLAAPLAVAGVPIFVVSTFETDYLLVRSTDLERALTALEGAGHRVAPRAPD